jgi:hypothetical protein
LNVIHTDVASFPDDAVARHRADQNDESCNEKMRAPRCCKILIFCRTQIARAKNDDFDQSFMRKARERGDLSALDSTPPIESMRALSVNW